jgi:anti-sigma B factor antagonist
MGLHDLDLTPITVGDCAVVRVTGEIDVLTAQDLRDVLRRQGSAHMIVDLRGVAFLDSTGLGVLVGAVKRQRSRGGTFKVVAERRGRVQRLFELTHLTNALNMRASVVDAIVGDENWQTAIGSSPDDWCREHELL